MTYVYKASSEEYKNSNGETKLGLDSKKMRKQVAKHMDKLNKFINDINLERFKKKGKGRNSKIKKW